MTLFLGDCIDLMRSIPDASIDALISDPPYGTTALKFDKARIDWAAWWTEAERITKPTAPIVLFAQQPFTTDLIVSNRKMFRYLLVWHKNMPTGFLDANARPLRAHEDILVFAHSGAIGSNKNRPTYNPQKIPGGSPTGQRRSGVNAHSGQRRIGSTVPFEGRHPVSVVQFDNNNGNQPNYVRHPTAKPIDLMRWLVATYSNSGETVLDSFMGSGTTGVACVQLGRQFIGMELDETYYRLSQQRIADAQPDSAPVVYTSAPLFEASP
ncbi:DNA-methyltransferase [Deinococcus ruber]|uniref:Methyltransferase n=1 Tax=Deinococcus ruber TaxID=1848197 RepID=A0A918CM42_9DEIO|nr:site-specific DNA-methyltransferase [Deinococcus ruber]GGR31343.1 methyltransferase [Deinococcus ruber]